MDINAAFPSRFLKAADLRDASPIVTIERVEMEEVGAQGQPKEQKPVVYFKGKVRGLVLNKTNANAITRIAGSPDTDDWVGVQVELFVAQVEFAGDIMSAIRVRAPRKAPAAATTARPAPIQANSQQTDEELDAIPF